jgi:hypothetical protein
MPRATRSRSWRLTRRPTSAPSSARSVVRCRASWSPGSITRSGPQSASRCRLASASPPSARVKRKTGSGRKRRPNGAPRDRVATDRRQRQRGNPRNRLRAPRRRVSPHATRRTAAARAPATVSVARGRRLDRRNPRGAHAVGTRPVAPVRAHRLTLLRDHDPGRVPPVGHRAAAARARAADHGVDGGYAAGAAAADRGRVAPNASPDPRATAP